MSSRQDPARPSRAAGVTRGSSTAFARLVAVGIGLVSALCACSSSPLASTNRPSMLSLGDILIYRGDPGSLFTIDADGRNEKLIHQAWDGIGLSPDGQTLLSPTLAPDGRLLPLLVATDGSGEGFLALNDPTLQMGVTDWSPDGARLVFEAWDDTDQSRKGIYTVSRSGSDIVRLTTAGWRRDFPAYAGAYSPDGGRILFLRPARSEEHTSELQSRVALVCRLLLEK